MIKNLKNKNTCKYLNYAENMLIPSSTTTACVSISAGIKKYKSIVKTKEEKAW